MRVSAFLVRRVWLSHGKTSVLFATFDHARASFRLGTSRRSPAADAGSLAVSFLGPTVTFNHVVPKPESGVESPQS